MTKKKMHHLYLHVARALITFAPFLYLGICIAIQSLSMADNGFQWSSMDSFATSVSWYANFNTGVFGSMFVSNGVYALVNSAFASLFSLLGMSASNAVVKFVNYCCTWLVLSQLIYFIVWVFDWIIDFMMDLIDCLKHKVARHE